MATDFSSYPFIEIYLACSNKPMMFLTRLFKIVQGMSASRGAVGTPRRMVWRRIIWEEDWRDLFYPNQEISSSLI